MDFKIELSQFLHRKGINQSQLAEILGTTPSNVNRWATGLGVPSHSICRRLLLEGMTVKELFGIEIAGDAKVYVDDEELERKVKGIIVRAIEKG